jgi:hypothetical protein
MAQQPRASSSKPCVVFETGYHELQFFFSQDASSDTDTASACSSKPSARGFTCIESQVGNTESGFMQRKIGSSSDDGEHNSRNQNAYRSGK